MIITIPEYILLTIMAIIVISFLPIIHYYFNQANPKKDKGANKQIYGSQNEYRQT